LGVALLIFGLGGFFYGMALYGDRSAWAQASLSGEPSPYGYFLLTYVPRFVLVGAASTFFLEVILVMSWARETITGEQRGS
jgi:hypothetical protein